jgi:lipopolysaccharide biosynthesis glycosyltransferase
MKTKVVYVVVSSPADVYLEQAYVSMYSLKYYMPDAYIVLLTDYETSESFEGVRKEEIKYADEVKVVDYRGTKFNAQQRSRQLKTSIRQLIKGDFLYIDCDTIVTRCLDEIDSIDALIAACRDSHCEFIDNPYRDMNLKWGGQLGWPITQETQFFNGGVTYVKDVPEAYEFYHHWNENLTNGYKMNVFQDQPTFAKTNYEMNHIVQQLPDEWNCELKHGIRYLKDAFIVHYLCTNPSKYQSQQLFLLNESSVWEELKENGIISKRIMETIKDPFCGLAELTHVFSGEDIYFFQTKEFNFVRRHFRRGSQSRLFSMLQFLNVLERLINRFKRIAQGKANLNDAW